jgi:hypothetical protein
MGRYLDRTNRRDQSTQQGFSTGGPADLVIPETLANPVIERLKIAIGYMTTKFAGTRDARVRIINKIVTEALDDVTDCPPAIAEVYLKQLAGIVWWVGTNEKLDMFDWPEGFDIDE